MWLSLVTILAVAQSTAASPPYVTCDRNYNKIGCFDVKADRVDADSMQMLVNDRDVNSQHFQGHILNWRELAQSVHSLACRCVKKARELGYEYISIRYWAECYGGKDFAAISKTLYKFESTNCANPRYQSCIKEDDDECVGKGGSGYIYKVGSSSSTDTDVDGGLAEWSEWSECTATCGEEIMKERERSCTNPVPSGKGAPCEGEMSETKLCDVPKCPVDGGFGVWSEYSKCSKSCGGGIMTRSRECNDPSPANGGKQCTGETIETISCASSPCPVDGGYGPWSQYSTCSAECGDGTQSRSRECNNPAPQYGGNGCESFGDKLSVRTCKVKECPIDGKYGQWSSFSACSKKCGGGTRSRSRSCNNPAPQHGGKSCVGDSNEEEKCNTDPCPVNGGFTKWSSYSSCSVSCGGGHKERSRTCTNPEPAHGGNDCSGPIKERLPCNSQSCPVDGKYGQWSSFSVCSKKCGGGTRSRSRSCNNPAPQHGGKSCVGDSNQVERCNTHSCPVNGGFTKWSSYSSCSVSCGGGYKERSRSCTNPEPAHGGNDCSGPAKERLRCNTQSCPVDGGYGSWSAFSRCTKTCGTGTQKRSRSCNNPKPQHGGSNCVGKSEESQVCNTTPCKIDGGWSEYSAYGPCSKSCGRGIQRKMRYCTNPKPAYGGAACSGQNNMIRICNMHACPIDGGYGSWSGYGSCSRNCGGGTQTRSRRCNNPSPSNGGKDCSRFGAATDSKRCNTHACQPPLSAQKTARVCEHHTMNLNCGQGGRIQIESANYGRTSKSYCGWMFWWKTNCRSGSSRSQMFSRCHNRQSCSVRASNSVFGDPCFITVKYLEVKYRCRGGPYTG